MWEIFVKTMRSGKTNPGLDRNIFVFLVLAGTSGVQRAAGRAYTICDDTGIRFEIIQSFWEDFTIVQRLYTLPRSWSVPVTMPPPVNP